MSEALVIYSPSEQVALAAEVWPLANKLCDTEFVPRALRGRPEAVLACMLKGSELGIGLMQSLSAIHVIDARPTMSAELMRAVVQSRGHQIVVEETSATRCIVKGRRVGDSEWQRFTFTMDDAERGGVTGKEVWRKWPQSMLLARASGLLCRAVFADCLAGISYTPEELGAPVDADGLPEIVIEEEPPPPVKPKRSRRKVVAPSADNGTYDAPPAKIVDQDVPRPGPSQIAIALKAHGVTTSEDRGRAIRQIITRPVTSSRDLVPSEIATVLAFVATLVDDEPFPYTPTDPPSWVGQPDPPEDDPA